MHTATIQAIKARKNLGVLLEMAYYQNKQFRIARKDKAMARLVSENFMIAIDQLIEDDPALADTLAIMLNPEICEALEQGEKDYQAGKAIPIDDVLQGV